MPGVAGVPPAQRRGLRFGRSEVAAGSGERIDQVNPGFEQPQVGFGRSPGAHRERAAAGPLRQSDHVPAAEAAGCADLLGTQVDQPEPGHRHPLAPHPCVVPLVGPALIRGRRLVAREHGDQIGIGEWKVLTEPAPLGRQRGHGAARDPEPVQLRDASVGPVGAEEDRLTVRGPPGA
jgi:hypothetical protein